MAFAAHLLFHIIGADYKILDKDGVSALMSASAQGHYDITKYLLDKLKADGTPEKETKDFVNLASYSGGTSVMFSAHFGAYNVTELLIENGADINLHAQATPEYLENYAKAIEDGTIDTKDANFEPHVDGVTALTVAAQKGIWKHVNCCSRTAPIFRPRMKKTARPY